MAKVKKRFHCQQTCKIFVGLKTTVSRDVMLCRLIKMCRRFGRTFPFRVQVRINPYSSALQIAATSSADYLALHPAKQ